MKDRLRALPKDASLCDYLQELDFFRQSPEVLQKLVSQLETQPGRATPCADSDLAKDLVALQMAIDTNGFNTVSAGGVQGVHNFGTKEGRWSVLALVLQGNYHSPSQQPQDLAAVLVLKCFEPDMSLAIVPNQNVPCCVHGFDLDLLHFFSCTPHIRFPPTCFFSPSI